MNTLCPSRSTLSPGSSGGRRGSHLGGPASFHGSTSSLATADADDEGLDGSSGQEGRLVVDASYKRERDKETTAVRYSKTNGSNKGSAQGRRRCRTSRRESNIPSSDSEEEIQAQLSQTRRKVSRRRRSNVVKIDQRPPNKPKQRMTSKLAPPQGQKVTRSTSRGHLNPIRAPLHQRRKSPSTPGQHPPVGVNIINPTPPIMFRDDLSTQYEGCYLNVNLAMIRQSANSSQCSSDSVMPLSVSASSWTSEDPATPGNWSPTSVMSTVDWSRPQDEGDDHLETGSAKKTSNPKGSRKKSDNRCTLPPITTSEIKMVEDLSNMTIVETYRRISQVSIKRKISEKVNSERGKQKAYGKTSVIANNYEHCKKKDESRTRKVSTSGLSAERTVRRLSISPQPSQRLLRRSQETKSPRLNVQAIKDAKKRKKSSFAQKDNVLDEAITNL